MPGKWQCEKYLRNTNHGVGRIRWSVEGRAKDRKRMKTRPKLKTVLPSQSTKGEDLDRDVLDCMLLCSIYKGIPGMSLKINLKLKVRVEDVEVR